MCVVDALVHGAGSRSQLFDAIGPAVPTIGSGIATTLHEFDVTEHPDTLVALLRGCDLAINLATTGIRCCALDPVGGAEAISAVGAVVPFACADAGVRRYVYVSSSEIYGEATEGPLHEGSVPRPQTTYGAAKLAGEHYAEAARLAHGIESVIVRPFNAYGPGCHLRDPAAELIARALRLAQTGVPVEIHGDGLQTRDFCHVDDLARGIVDAALHPAATNTGPINLCSGVERTVLSVDRDVIACLWQSEHTRMPPRAGQGEIRHLPPRAGDLRRQVGCVARAATILGWSPRVAWENGLRGTVEAILTRLESLP